MSPYSLIPTAARRFDFTRQPPAPTSSLLFFAHWAALWAAATWFATPIVASSPPLGHSFDGPELAWRLLEPSNDARLLSHEHAAADGRDRGGCERLVLAAPAGQSAFVHCASAPVAVLDELVVRLWVKASRPDVQLAARIVMPRSTDGQGKVVTALVRGPAYSRPGQWQQLSLSDVPKLLAAEVRIMRAGSSAKVDPREAFVDAIILVVPGEPNGVEVCTDELEIEGILVAPADRIQQASFEAPPPMSSPSTSSTAAPGGLLGNSSAPVRLHGSLLLVEGRPFLPRAIEWQGESLEFLARQGFNTVELPEPPTPEQIA